MTQPPKRILVPTDFSPLANRALPLAKKIAELFSAEITLLHVVETLIYPDFYALDSLPEVRMKEVTSHCDRSRTSI